MRRAHLLMLHALLQTSIECLVLRNGIPIDGRAYHFKERETYIRIQSGDEGSSNVSSWKSHVQNVLMCEKTSLDDLTSGKWYKSDEGRFLFEPDTCRLHRLSGELVRRCLNKRHLMFIGDSVIRYQYLNLVYFLSKLERMESYGGVSGIPSLCMEMEWKNWEQFYHFTSESLGAAVDGTSSEVCDCFRSVDLAQTREFRTWRLNFPGGCHTQPSPEGLLTVSYKQVFSYPDALSAGKLAWTYLEPSEQLTSPDLVILNMGLHLQHLGADHQAVLSEILASGVATRSKYNISVLWKTTTPHKEGLSPNHHLDISMAQRHGFATYDVGNVVFASKQQGLNFYWDNVHYLPFVYEQFNDILLNLLCV